MRMSGFVMCPRCGERPWPHTCPTTSQSAWLVEIALPIGDTLYYCGPGDWCSNPNHAHKFPTREAASEVLKSAHDPTTMRVAEHEWSAPTVGDDRG